MGKGWNLYENEDHAVPSLPPWATGRFYDGYPTSVSASGTGSASITANAIYAHPIWVPSVIDAVSLNVDVTAGAAGGTLGRMGLYDNAEDNIAYPGDLIVGTPTFAIDATGLVTEAIAVRLRSGMYWVAYLGNGAPAVRGLDVGTATWMGAGTRDALTTAAAAVAVFGQVGLTADGMPDRFPNFLSTNVIRNSADSPRVLIGT